MVVKVNNLND